MGIKTICNFTIPCENLYFQLLLALMVEESTQLWNTQLIAWSTPCCWVIWISLLTRRDQTRLSKSLLEQFEMDRSGTGHMSPLIVDLMYHSSHRCENTSVQASDLGKRKCESRFLAWHYLITQPRRSRPASHFPTTNVSYMNHDPDVVQ